MALLAFALTLVIAPAIFALWLAPAADARIALPSFSIARSTIGWAIAVASIATLIGLFVAPALAFGSRMLCALATWPLLLPGYFAYSGLSILRAPGSALGDFLASQSAAGNTALASSAGATFALLGLALSVWPLPAFLIASSIQNAGPSVRDALKLDANKVGGAIETLKMLWPAVAGSCAIVTFVMLGSPIAFHLAQIRTISIAAWIELQGSASPWSAWMIMLPLLIPVVAGATWLASNVRALAVASSEDTAVREGARRGNALSAFLALGFSLALPAALFALSVREPRAYVEFWHLNTKPIVSSAQVAAFCGLCSVLIFYWFASRAGQGSKIVTAATAILLIGGLSPGILVGSVWSVLTLKLPAWFGDSPAPVVVSHLTRFAMIPALAGLFAGASESRIARDQRLMDGAVGVRGYVSARFRQELPVALGACLLVFVLSLHEIESSVLVQPPGMQSIAARMLNDLHQLRMDSVSAAALWLWMLGAIPALVAAWLIQRRSNQ